MLKLFRDGINSIRLIKFIYSNLGHNIIPIYISQQAEEVPSNISARDLKRRLNVSLNRDIMEFSPNRG